MAGVVDYVASAVRALAWAFVGLSGLAGTAGAVEEGSILWRAHMPGLSRATACTAALVATSGGAVPLLVTARHCAPVAGERVELVTGTTGHRPGKNAVVSGGRQTDISGLDLVEAAGFDLLWSALPDNLHHPGPVRQPAANLPPPGTRLQVSGYPGGTGPSSSVCTLIGPALRADRPLHGFRVDQEMSCPARDNWRGISGAPVIDPQGQVVGIVLAASPEGTSLYFQPLLAGNLQAAGEGLRPGDGSGQRRYENVRLGAGQRGYRLEVALEAGQLHGPATLYEPTGAPYARLTFNHADLVGPVMLFRQDGSVMLDATLAAGRMTVRLFSPAAVHEGTEARRRLPGDQRSGEAVSRLINWSLMGHVSD